MNLENSANGSIATKEEILSAIENQIKSPSTKISALAYWILNKHPSIKAHMSVEELLHETYIAALGSRNWKKSEIDFETFIGGVMRSIASNESRKAKHTLPDITYVEDDYKHESDLGTVTAEKTHSPEEANIQREEAATNDAQLSILRAMLEPNELKILNMLLDGFNKSDIRIALGMTEKQFRAADRRLIRAIEKFRRE